MKSGETLKERCARAGSELQETISARLEALEGASFSEESWSRPGGGGGRSRILSGGNLFEKAGVNFSEVHGELTEEFARQLPGNGRSFYATGISLVLHPQNPRVPAVHANFRYLEHGSSWWFGGGSDLTPYRLYEEDARHFHRVWKEICDRHDPGYYPRFKKWCDQYFFLPHRGEARGIGGIFFDDLSGDPQRLLDFWEEIGRGFLPAYIPILERRRAEPYTPEEREFQLHRRGRYVEFNLLYDRGTLFGLKTAGRVESILMSLPPLVRWEYNPPPPTSGPEAELIRVLKEPRDWLEGEPLSKEH